MTTNLHAFGTDRLLDRLGSQPFALAFAGQGFDWLSTLAQATAAGAGSDVQDIVDAAGDLLAPVAAEVAASRPFGFAPVDWAKAMQQEGAPTYDFAQAAVSVPGIFVSQLAVLNNLEAQGLPIENAVAAIGHSQGVLGKHLLADLLNPAPILAIAELVGVCVAHQARKVGLIQNGDVEQQGTMPMLLIQGISREKLQAAIDQLFDAGYELRPQIGLRNGFDAYVLVGTPDDVARVQDVLAAWAAKDAQAIADKLKGGTPFNPTFIPLNVQVGFHHTALIPAVDRVVKLAEACGLDVDLARSIAEDVIVNPVDWVVDVNGAVDAGARWIFDVGPGGGVDMLTAPIIAGLGVGSFAIDSAEGQARLFDLGQPLELPTAWSSFAPRVEQVDGRTRVVTKFTELTGRSPMLLPGMTPTTVDPEIVAAAANAGHWAELAGGGQVTPEILEGNLAKLQQLLEPGVNAQFNSMFLDPYLWKMQIGGKRLVAKARANGAPIDGVVVTAGMPEHDEAVALVHELRAAGFPWVVFKPGAIKQIINVLAVARAVPSIPIIIQVEGGRAGGHHSWEDLDDLLLATYADIRACDNVVLCVGGGIGTPERAADYITGEWARAYDRPLMPVDGILLGTVAMACKEAKTSDSVKQLLVDTKGIDEWIGAGHAKNGMASGRSQLGADIHEIDNSAAKAGRLLDDVAGDEAAVTARRAEIIEAIGKTAKPYFGDLEAMTYAEWLGRYLELSGPTEEYPNWVDVSWQRRFEQMVARAEARLNPQDKGEFDAQVDVAGEPRGVINRLEELYPQAATQLLHPADVAWFVKLARTPGKPVNFVPVIDKDVRRWWRSDSLWQAHDPRYDADQVCVIPGTEAVAGITVKDEPVADLLQRFCDVSAERVQALAAQSDETQVDAAGIEARDVVTHVLHAPGTFWAGRNTGSLVARIGEPSQWTITDDAAGDGAGAGAVAVHKATGAQLRALDETHAELIAPIGGAGTTGGALLRIRLTADPSQPHVVPVVTQEDAEAAMGELTRVAAGGTLAEVEGGVARAQAQITEDLIAQYNTVTQSFLPGEIRAGGTAPDVLVGLAWPAVFAAVKAAVIPGTDAASVVEGMLSLVHLEHHLKLVEETLPAAGTSVDIEARAEEVSDTDMGRIVVVRARLSQNGQSVATLSERFAIRGRGGKAVARTNTSILPSVVDTPRSFRAQAYVTAPQDMTSFAIVTGDRNPIHVSDTAAALAGLPGVIVHGMWTSAIAELIAAGAYVGEQGPATRASRVVEYTATMLAPILPGARIEFVVERAGVDNRPGCGEVREVTATVDGNLVLKATAVMAAPTTFYAFPGQGIQSQGMGMDAYGRSAAARGVWDRADAHTRAKLGFSVLEIVRNNPVEVVVQGERFHHPKGVLFLTQFTQVAMATLGVAQVAEMREASALNQRAFFAGHSVGEYNALAAYAGVLSLESVVEIVYRRGLTMHRLVDRDEQGNSNYGLAALRPNKMGLTADNVAEFVAQVSQQSGEFLEIVNYNLAGLQYAVAGTVAGLKALGAAAESKAPGQRALIMIPGIDVPFHSSVLRDGVADFREHLTSLLPDRIDLEVLLGRYIPNLVARPFELSLGFVDAMREVVDSPLLDDAAEFFASRGDQVVGLEDQDDPEVQRVARTMLIELLAWQFASPVRWIETQDLALTTLGGHGVDRFVEVGVGSAPTIANMMGQTLRLPQYAAKAASVEVLNVERERAIVFASDEVTRDVIVEEQQEAPVAEASHTTNQALAATETPETPAAPAAPAGGERPADLAFTPADATELLVALWTKVRPDQMAPADSIEALVEGVSSRRNQLLLDLGVEFGLGAIDGAADAELSDLKVTVTKMAKSYTAFGPVLSDATADALRRITGPTGKRPAYVAERVTGTWQLGQGWADHVVAAVVTGSREGASLRGGDLATLSPASPSNAGELDALIDAAVAQVAANHGVSVGLPSAGGAGGGVVDSAALGEFAEQVTGKAGVLAETARTILAQLGLNHVPQTEGLSEDEADEKIFELISRELGSDWPRQVSRAFTPERAVLLDDRWASAREDLARLATGAVDAAQMDAASFTGAGEAVAAQAEYWGLSAHAAAARDTRSLPLADDVAVVTGASPNSIAASVVANLLQQGATVVVTTSSLGHARLGYYKDLYRNNARGNAALWVAPANLSSYGDLDALIEWIGNEQTATVNGQKKQIKPALVPTLLFPFAAPRVMGTLADAGPRAENEMRLLLWSVERLIAGLSEIAADTHVGRRMHVVLPGSPNRGRFGGDGAYGEAKAALDAVVTRWYAEPVWGNRTSLVHAHIGWVRGTGLMGGNDPLVDAVEAAGVTTYSTEEMAEKLVAQVTTEVREQAATGPVTVDFTGGLGEADLDLAQLGRDAQRAAEAASTTEDAEPTRVLTALPNPYAPPAATSLDFSSATRSLDEMVVIVGAGELGPYGSSRTRFDAELSGDLSAAGVIELAWSMGLINWDNGWVITDGGEEIDEADIYARFHDEVLGRVGVRRYHDDFGMVDNLAPELTTIYLDQPLSFQVASKEDARTFVDSEDGTTAHVDPETGEWIVTRPAGSAVRVPRRMAMSRFVGGQIPEGFDPKVWGIPADMADSLDRVACWNLVCTVDAFLSSGFTPAEIMRAIHPTRVSSTQGTGMGGMESMRSLYIDRLLAEPRANDILQEALPNVVAAHVMQSYVGGYGQMIHPVAACATAAVSVEEGMDKIRLGKADFVVTGGLDDLSIEGITGFGDMAATAPSGELAAKGIEERYFSRANDRRRAGFVESAGGGTILLARGSVAAQLGLPVHGVVAFAESFADGAHTSIPAPGLGALSAAQGGLQSRLAVALRDHGVSADEVTIISKHDTSTTANDPNESDLHERIAASLGRAQGNPLFVISQKTLTGHAKGGAAAFQIIGLTQVLRGGVIPPNRSLDCVDPVLAKHQHLVWLRQPLAFQAKAGLVTSLGFGHVSALIAIVHPDLFVQLASRVNPDYAEQASRRERAGYARIVSAMYGGDPLYTRPVDRNLGASGDAAKEREAAVLLDPAARLVDGVLRTSSEL